MWAQHCKNTQICLCRILQVPEVEMKPNSFRTQGLTVSVHTRGQSEQTHFLPNDHMINGIAPGAYVSRWVGKWMSIKTVVFFVFFTMGMLVQVGGTQRSPSIQLNATIPANTGIKEEWMIWRELNSKLDTQGASLYACSCPPNFHAVTDRYK